MAGLSWLTILRKRESFRAAFRGFDPALVARFGARDATRLMNDAGIVRNRAKIDATINNARRYPALMQVATSLEAVALSKDLRRRGWGFVGPTTVYSFMQAMGLVNDHIRGCAAGAEVQRLRRAFTPPR